VTPWFTQQGRALDVRTPVHYLCDSQHEKEALNENGKEWGWNAFFWWGERLRWGGLNKKTKSSFFIHETAS
jgi:hypothetical protein